MGPIYDSISGPTDCASQRADREGSDRRAILRTGKLLGIRWIVSKLKLNNVLCACPSFSFSLSLSDVVTIPVTHSSMLGKTVGDMTLQEQEVGF